MLSCDPSLGSWWCQETQRGFWNTRFLGRTPRRWTGDLAAAFTECLFQYFVIWGLEISISGLKVDK